MKHKMQTEEVVQDSNVGGSCTHLFPQTPILQLHMEKFPL